MTTLNGSSFPCCAHCSCCCPGQHEDECWFGCHEVDRPGWDRYFLSIARAVSARAECLRAKHGCVIVDVDHRIVSTGYNGSPAGEDASCLKGDCPRAASGVPSLSPYEGAGRCISLHAEQNAVAYGDWNRMRGGTAYITGAPCESCTKLLQAAGVERIVW